MVQEVLISKHLCTPRTRTNLGIVTNDVLQAVSLADAQQPDVAETDYIDIRSSLNKS
jgi:hypothetical protein